MRLFLCLAILFLLLDMQVSAQTTGTSNQKAKPAPFAPYRFPAFAQGMVFLRNKDTVSIYLNYNVVRNEMQFINGHGDTLKLKDPLTVTKIFIKEEEFYYNKVYYYHLNSNIGNSLIRVGIIFSINNHV